MAPKQNVPAVKVKVIHVASAPKMVELNGVFVEMQTCHIADDTDHIKIQLWERQLGALISGRWYEIINLSTREFGGDLFPTANRFTEMNEVAALSGVTVDASFAVDEGETRTLTGHVTGAQVTVRRCCTKCCAWQAEVEGKQKFHCCEKCGMVQRFESFQANATAKVSLSGDFGEEDVKLSNSVLRKYLEKEGLLDLLSDRQDVEEHLFEVGLCTFKMLDNIVVAVEKVENALKAVAEEENLNEGEATEMDGWFPEGGDLFDEPVPTTSDK
ncbi:hypothetical protein R3I94_008723 [Phoxinus phoxinus]